MLPFDDQQGLERLEPRAVGRIGWLREEALMHAKGVRRGSAEAHPEVPGPDSRPGHP